MTKISYCIAGVVADAAFKQNSGCNSIRMHGPLWSSSSERNVKWNP